MWYLVINQESERFFIKKKDDNNSYLTDRHMDKINTISIKELQQNNFRIVGEAFKHEVEKLERLLQVA